MDQAKGKLGTVRVPAELEPAFASAERLVSHYFAARRDNPEQGTIEIFDERYVLVRAASLSVEFFSVVRDLYGSNRTSDADDFARNLLFDLAHSIGHSDARRFHTRMKSDSLVERIATGPVHFSHTGWAFVDILPESRLVPGEDFCLIYDHPYSFEASAWLASQLAADFPVCIMNAGYSSGWCQESSGVRLLAAEVRCRARGDQTCRFVMAHPDRLEREIQRHVETWEEPGARTYAIPDIFARKRLEEELRLARDTLEERVRERTAELERTNALLCEQVRARELAEKQLLQSAKLEVVGRLAGAIAHDFNNLISVVIGHASLLENRLVPGDAMRAHLLEIQRAGVEAGQLTQQLLAFSRAQVLHTELLDLNLAVRETMYMMGRLMGERVEVALVLGHDVGSVRADRSQLRQVIMNLVVNARDAMPSGGLLRIETERADVPEVQGRQQPPVRPGRWALLTVSDSGVGMDAETASQAFEPFFTTKAAAGGTGLGLSTVQRIVTQSDGAITLSSSPGQGSLFRVYLPAADSVTDEQGTGELTAPDLPTGHETILVVEDQPAMRRVVVGMLRALGYQVLEAGDGEDAMRTASAYPSELHLLLTDIVLPKMSGPTLAEQLTPLRSGMRVLFMSGYAEPEAVSRCLTRSTAPVLRKPFTQPELAQTVRQALYPKGDGVEPKSEGASTSG